MQSVSRPLLSIVVPSRNRYETLTVLVTEVMRWTDERFELIVQDNSDDPTGFADTLAHHSSDVRFRYHHDPVPVSAIENCNAAVARARGDVVTFIGDDDLLTRHCVAAAQWMIEQQVDALSCAIGSYTWPDMLHAMAVNQQYNGRLLDQSSVGSLEWVDVPAQLQTLVRRGAQTMARVPRLYHAMVQRGVLDALHRDVGSYFPGPVPDMANAIAIAKYVQRCAHTDIPLVISGQSRKSMSGKNSVRLHQGSIAGEASLPAGAAEIWDARIPRFWSAPTIWAEAAIKAAGATNQQNLIRDFSFAWVYASCLAYNDRRYFGLVWKAILSNGWLAGLGRMPKIAWCWFRITAQRAIIFARKLAFGVDGRTFATVAEATKYLEDMIDNQELMARAFIPLTSTERAT